MSAITQGVPRLLAGMVYRVGHQLQGYALLNPS